MDRPHTIHDTHAKNLKKCRDNMDWCRDSNQVPSLFEWGVLFQNVLQIFILYQ